MNLKTFYSNGKLLITGEYVVLDGALSLAVPTKFGQSLKITTIDYPKIIWKSYDEKGTIWFEDSFLIEQIDSLDLSRNDFSRRLIQILKSVQQLNPNFLSSGKGYEIFTYLDFKREWGLGTSSTLINNIAQWTEVDAYRLLEMTFGGSGYDIACAQNNHPITYQLQNSIPKVNAVNFNPDFKNDLYFVYLNKKQNSRDGIAQYKSNNTSASNFIDEINHITSEIISCQSLSFFEKLITHHETIISKLIKQKPVKALFFNDFKGSIKSLGAWGGDFILVTSETNPEPYFKSKGFETIIPFSDMILKH